MSLLLYTADETLVLLSLFPMEQKWVVPAIAVDARVADAILASDLSTAPVRTAAAEYLA